MRNIYFFNLPNIANQMKKIIIFVVLIEFNIFKKMPKRIVVIGELLVNRNAANYLGDRNDGDTLFDLVVWNH